MLGVFIESFKKKKKKRLQTKRVRIFIYSNILVQKKKVSFTKWKWKTFISSIQNSILFLKFSLFYWMPFHLCDPWVNPAENMLFIHIWTNNIDDGKDTIVTKCARGICWSMCKTIWTQHLFLFSSNKNNSYGTNKEQQNVFVHASNQTIFDLMMSTIFSNFHSRFLWWRPWNFAIKIDQCCFFRSIKY